MNNKFMQILLISIFIISAFVFFKNQSISMAKNYGTLQEGDLIIGYGDSLTYGFGASAESSYPSILSKLININVFNSGVNGEMSGEGLRRLPSVLQMKPKLVILCHGGNDILRKTSMADLKHNLIAMIQLIRQSGSNVVLVGIPDFNVFGINTHDVYYEVSDELNVLLEDKALEYIQARRNLKSDIIHPNALGYEIIAKNLYELFKKNNIVK